MEAVESGLPDDPSQIGLYPPPPELNPLVRLTDHQLEQSLLSLRLVCGRNKSVFKAQKRQYACLLFQTLTEEKARRNPDVR